MLESAAAFSSSELPHSPIQIETGISYAPTHINVASDDCWPRWERTSPTPSSPPQVQEASIQGNASYETADACEQVQPAQHHPSSAQCYGSLPLPASTPQILLSPARCARSSSTQRSKNLLNDTRQSTVGPKMWQGLRSYQNRESLPHSLVLERKENRGYGEAISYEENQLHIDALAQA